MVVLGRGHPVILLHHDVVINPERIVEFAVMGLEIDSACRRVVMVYLHHTRKDAVVILAQQLGYYHGEYPEGAAYHYVVELGGVFRFRNAKSVQNLPLEYGPPFAADETGDEVLARQLTPELGCAVDLQLRQCRLEPGKQLAEYGVAVGVNLRSAQPLFVSAYLQSGKELDQPHSFIVMKPGQGTLGYLLYRAKGA